MKDFILFVWQLPQNIVGMLVVLCTKAHRTLREYYFTDRYRFGVSLGQFIIFGKYHPKPIDMWHEAGHQKQSLYLGPLYLLLIGLPSVCGNLWDRVFHKHWAPAKREKWYYSLIWEAWADRLSGIQRFSKGDKNA